MPFFKNNSFLQNPCFQLFGKNLLFVRIFLPSNFLKFFGLKAISLGINCMLIWPVFLLQKIILNKNYFFKSFTSWNRWFFISLASGKIQRNEFSSRELETGDRENEHFNLEIDLELNHNKKVRNFPITFDIEIPKRKNFRTLHLLNRFEILQSQPYTLGKPHFEIFLVLRLTRLYKWTKNYDVLLHRTNHSC